jgi:glycosyltransferase involved in cell wall biosynthesis
VASAVEHERSGLIIDATDPLAVEQALVALIQNPSQRQQLGQFGLERARRSFDWQIISKEIAQIL